MHRVERCSWWRETPFRQRRPFRTFWLSEASKFRCRRFIQSSTSCTTIAKYGLVTRFKLDWSDDDVFLANVLRKTRAQVGLGTKVDEQECEKHRQALAGWNLGYIECRMRKDRWAAMSKCRADQLVRFGKTKMSETSCERQAWYSFVVLLCRLIELPVSGFESTKRRDRKNKNSKEKRGDLRSKWIQKESRRRHGKREQTIELIAK